MNWLNKNKGKISVDRNFGDNKSENILDMVGITKTFLGGKIIANDNIDLSIMRNEIHALIGENGSGKSTLMSILFGIYEPTGGTIFYNDKEIEISSPMIAKKLGIGMVHQHYQLVENMSVIENVLLGQEGAPILPIKNNFIDKKLRKPEDLEKRINDHTTKKIKQLEDKIIKIKQEIESKNKELDNKINKSESDKLVDKLLNKSDDYKKIMNKRIENYKDKISFYKDNYHNATKRFNDLVEKYKFNLEPMTKVFELTVGQKQKLEIIKVLWQDKDLIVFDEPTAALSIQEIQEFMNIIKSFKKDGKTVIFISHKLLEVRELADRLTILRKGKAIETTLNKNLNIDTISKKMIGELVKLEFNKKNIPTDKIIFELTNVETLEKEKEQKLTNINLQIREGEILGIAGVGDNGQTELLEAIIGLRKIIKGTIEVDNQDISKKTIRERNQLVAHVPEDRHKYGIVNDMNIVDNSVLNCIDLKQFSKLYIDKSIPTLLENVKEFKKYYIANLKVEIENINFTSLKKIKKIKKDSPLDKKELILKVKNQNKKDIQKLSSNYIKWLESLKLRINSYKKNKIILKEQELNKEELKKEIIDLRLKLELFDKRLNKGINLIKNQNEIVEWTKDIIHIMDVQGANEIKQQTRNLSGGNQQKFVIGREILQEHRVLIAGHPTRGLDVKAIKNIYRNIIEGSKKNATLLCSYELPELLAVCHRIAIIHRGKIQDVVETSDKKALEKISLAMVGGKQNGK